MSIKDNFPSVGPSLSLNFARSKTLDPRITFSRSSVGTYMDGNGLIVTAAADEPRFDHKYENDVVKSLGLLVEESRVTYTTHTEDPSQWIISNMITTGNSVTLPTGVASTSIEYRGETTDANSKLIRPTLSGASITAGDTWVFSIFLKAGTEDTVNITLQNNTATEGVRVNSFNMLTGEDSGIIESGGATNGEFDAISYPNDWWRIYVRGTFANNAGGMQTVLRLQGFSNQVTVTTSFSAWGAQLEKGSFMTSYIPNNTGSTVTRTADNVTMTGTNFSDWYNQDEGTMVWVGNVYSKEITPVQPFRINQGSNLRGMAIQFDTRSANNTVNFMSRTQSSNIPSKVGPTGVIPSDNKIKIAGGYIESVGLSTIRAAFNGLPAASYSGASQTDITYDTMNELEIMGDRGTSGTNIKFTGVCEQLVYYPKIFTDTQLQNLTK